MNILVINPGSSTIKFNLFNVQSQDNFVSLASGVFAKINGENSKFKIKTQNQKLQENVPTLDHKSACQRMIDLLKQHCENEFSQIDIVAYRVVHGGDFGEIQNAQTCKEKIFEIAGELTRAHCFGLRETVDFMMNAMPSTQHYFDFDTLFHIGTMKPEYYVYALPWNLCQKHKIRKYGEHGLSHKYISLHSKKIFGDGQVVISCHLGSGSSISCIDDGICLDNSMGLTPLAGVVMSTRCGNIDPSVITYLMKKENITPDQMDDIMNLQSGLKGICGEGDMATIVQKMQNGDKQAELAFDVAVNSYVKSIGGKILQVGDKIKSDMSNLKIVFCAGIGENSPLVRQKIVDKLKFLGIELDDKLNEQIIERDTKISSCNSSAEVWVLPTNEEIVVAYDVFEHLQNQTK